MKIRITKKFTFDMAHALHGHDGPCRNIHGHTYHLSVTLIGVPKKDPVSPKHGMVLDYSAFKELVNKSVVNFFDHALILNREPLHDGVRAIQDNYEKIILVSYQPTCENLLFDIKGRILPLLPKQVELHSLKLEETPTSYAEWHLSDNNYSK